MVDRFAAAVVATERGESHNGIGREGAIGVGIEVGIAGAMHKTLSAIDQDTPIVQPQFSRGVAIRLGLLRVIGFMGIENE